VNRSESIAKLSVALVKAHAEIGVVVKGASNPFFKSKYADLASVVEAVKPALLKQEIVVVQGLQDAEGGVAIETMLLHSSGEWISSTLRLPASKEDAQGYGSACTYGRRYGLMAICGVPADDDDGNAATATAPVKGSTGANDGALDVLNESEIGRAQMIAKRMVELDKANDLESARVLFYENNLTHEMQLGIWHFLQPQSGLRNRVKKLQDSKKPQPAKEVTA
jgi:hypothetical protein